MRPSPPPQTASTVDDNDHDSNTSQEKLLSADTIERLYQLPLLIAANADPDLAVASVLVRRYRASNRPCFQFHTDDHTCTVNIALSSADDYEGGDLHCLTKGWLVCPLCPLARWFRGWSIRPPARPLPEPTRTFTASS